MQCTYQRTVTLIMTVTKFIPRVLSNRTLWTSFIMTTNNAASSERNFSSRILDLSRARGLQPHDAWAFHSIVRPKKPPLPNSNWNVKLCIRHCIFITDLISHFRVAFSLCFKMSSVLSYENEMIYKNITNVQENLSSIKQSHWRL